MEVKHTPGPWTVEIDNQPEDGCTQIGSPKDFICQMYKGYDHPDIASFPTGREDQTEGEQQANARLIAAAPELLEALESAVVEISPAFNFDPAKYPVWLKQMEQAIKKALGA